MNLAFSNDKNEQYVISYLTIRKAVGILGMALPFALIVGHLFFQKPCAFPASISHFYYTDMGNLFVGTLCAVSLFLFTYNGYDRMDKMASKLAGSFALLVAVFPTNYGANNNGDCSRIVDGENIFSNTTHYLAATLLFSTFAFFSLVLFTKTNHTAPLCGPKKSRNTIYKVCGWVIIFCILSIALFSLIPFLEEQFSQYKPTFVFETLALLAFGFSWLIKGETFFKDDKLLINQQHP
ncbi:MAG: hypothetical protein WCJ85_09430 [Chitinophagaceae bacterium]